MPTLDEHLPHATVDLREARDYDPRRAHDCTFVYVPPRRAAMAAASLRLGVLQYHTPAPSRTS